MLGGAVGGAALAAADDDAMTAVGAGALGASCRVLHAASAANAIPPASVLRTIDLTSEW